MRLGRRLCLLMAMALGSIGCRAAGTGSLSLNPRPSPIQEPLVDLDQFVAEHNRNAALIQSLEASPAIKVAMPRRPEFPLEGRMALDRPRNFRLELFSHKDSKADIGSNAESSGSGCPIRKIGPSIGAIRGSRIQPARRDLPAGLDHRGPGTQADLSRGKGERSSHKRTRARNHDTRLRPDPESVRKLYTLDDRLQSRSADQATPDLYGDVASCPDRQGDTERLQAIRPMPEESATIKDLLPPRETRTRLEA